jgi:branched-chain amino acid transport system ATP-binding protein
MSNAAEPLLQIRGLTAGYGQVTILHGVDLAIGSGTITALIGANGAGKTTLMRTLAGLLPARAGSIRFAGREIVNLAAHHRVDSGIVLVPEGRMVFTLLTVEQNLRLGGIAPRARDGVDASMETVFGKFPRLRERRRQLAGSMSGGEQQMLAIGRGLMAKPQVILLDEPALGLAPIMVKQVFATIEGLRRDGYTVVLAEQNSRLALEIADYGYVFQNGRIQLSGTGAELSGSSEVRKAFLGH